MLPFQTVVFYAFAALLLASGMSVALARNPVHAAIFLVVAFFAMAGIWMLLLAEFLALALVLVYVGAVMVLFLFVLMMLDINLDRLREGFWRGVPLALAALALLGVEMLASLREFSAGSFAAAPPPDPETGNTRALGRLLYTQYAYPFQLAAVVLLAAMVAAIALTLRRRKDVKRLDPAAQAAVSPVGRVRLVAMQSDRPAEDADDAPTRPARPPSENTPASEKTAPSGGTKS